MALAGRGWKSVLPASRTSASIPPVDEVDDLLTAIFGGLPLPERLSASRRGLQTLVATRRTLAQLEAGLVSSARRDGATWREIADDLEVSRTTVRARQARRLPERRNGE